MNFSIIIPVYNEEKTVKKVIEGIKKCSGQDYEIIVINDGSTDKTKEILDQIENIKIINYSENKGYGSAIKSGVRQAQGKYILIIDGDGTYPTEAIPEILKFLNYDMVVGARIGQRAKIPLVRKPAKWLLNQIANYLSGVKIPDLNSGLRLIKKDLINKFLYLLPDGFSFTTSITLALISNKYQVKYIPIDYYRTKSKSKFRPIRDTLNYFYLIIRTILYFNPLKIFIPFSLILFFASLAVFAYSWFFSPRIMDVTVAILFISAIQIMVLGMLAELIVKLRIK